MTDPINLTPTDAQAAPLPDAHDDLLVPVETDDVPAVVQLKPEPEAAVVQEVEFHSDAEEIKPILVALPPSETAFYDPKMEIFSPLTDDEKANPFIEELYGPADEGSRMVQYFAGIPNFNQDDVQSANYEWGNAWNEGFQSIPRFGSFVASTKRKGSKWGQMVPTPKGMVGAAKPGEVIMEPGSKLKGPAAIRQIHAAIGLTGILVIPLWHSGFWIALRQPSESTLIDLQQRILQDKVDMGRMTSGLVFSNMSVYMTQHVLDVAMDHLHYHSIDIDQSASVRDYILTQDLQIIAWGLAALIWSKGFKYTRALLDDKGAADKTITEKINLNRMLFTDSTMLNDWQRSHMSNRGKSTVKLDMVKKYQAEFVYAAGKRIQINDTTFMTLRVPGLDKFIASGTKWVSSIQDMVTRVFTLELDDVSRNKYMGEQGQAQIMRQYGHWVESIEVNGFIVEDEESIESSLVALSQHAESRKAYMTKTREFIDETTFSCVCVPAITPQEMDAHKRHPHLVPIDALYTFFTLLDQKVLSIQQRVTD